MEKDELKSCPFCGARPGRIQGKFEPWREVRHRMNCYLMGRLVVEDLHIDDEESWNRRKT